jgi:hypothetical protein
MTETELRIAAVLSGLIACGGLATAIWAFKAEQRVFQAQGIMLLMVGLTLLALSLLPQGVLRTFLVMAFSGVGFGCMAAHFWFLRIERRTE